MVDTPSQVPLRERSPYKFRWAHFQLKAHTRDTSEYIVITNSILTGCEGETSAP